MTVRAWLMIGFTLVATACARDDQASGSLLYVWAGDADTAQPDFLAVLDADTASATYGQVLSTTSSGSQNNGPHHTEYQIGAATLFANGWGSGRTFIFDLADRGRPQLAGSFDHHGTWRYPHSYARLPNGNVLATVQSSGDSGYTPSGGLVELDNAGTVVRSASTLTPAVPARENWSYSLLVLADIDRVIGTHTRMGMSPARTASMEAAHRHVSPDAASTHVQIWRLSDLSLLSTVRLPPQTGGNHQYVAEARRTAGGEVFVNTFTCGLFRLTGLQSDTPRAEPALMAPFQDPGYCAVPVVLGNYWIQPNATERAIVSLDLSDPARPREVSRITLDSSLVAPHWLGLDSAGGRIVVTSSDLPWILMLRIDRSTGVLSVDERFGTAGQITFDREQWPHGASGQAQPHGAVFSR